MFGPVDTSAVHTVITVHKPCQVKCLRRAVLPRGVYLYPGDLRPKMRSVNEKRAVLAGLYSVEVHNAPDPEIVPTWGISPESTIGEPQPIVPDTNTPWTAGGVWCKKLNGRTKLRNLDGGVLYKLRGGYTLMLDADTNAVVVERQHKSKPIESHQVRLDDDMLASTSAAQLIKYLFSEIDPYQQDDKETEPSETGQATTEEQDQAVDEVPAVEQPQAVEQQELPDSEASDAPVGSPASETIGSDEEYAPTQSTVTPQKSVLSYEEPDENRPQHFFGITP